MDAALLTGLDEYDRQTMEYLSLSGVHGAALERVANSLRHTTN